LNDEVLALDITEVAQILPEGLQEGIGSRRTGTGIEPTNPGDFPCWLRRGGKYHCEDTQSQGDDAPRRSAPHETFLLCCWLLFCLTAFTSGCGMVMSLWQPNARGEPPPIAGATQERRLLAVGSSAWFGWARQAALDRATIARFPWPSDVATPSSPPKDHR